MKPSSWIAPLICAAILLSAHLSHARDIDLDSIYIKKSSPPYQKLFQAKLEAYQKVGARLIDRDIIHAHWISGFDILYIKETPTSNIGYLYNRKSQNVTELFRFTGTPTVVRTTLSGRYLFIKRILIEESGMPRGDGFCFDLLKKNKHPLPGAYPFMDFTISPSGNAYAHENAAGIVEVDIASAEKRLVLKKTDYSGIATADSPSLLFLSPNRQNMVALCGSGGNYRAKIFFGGKAWIFSEITSPLEFFWISNNSFVYRKGGTGNFSVYLYDVKEKSSTLILANSLHTSIGFSPYPKILSCLKDQIIHYYSLRDKKMIGTGLEGDDVAFSPDGNRFISLIKQRLFMTEISSLLKKQPEVRKVHRTIADLYKSLLSAKNFWENEYTPVYLNRKLSLYQ